MEIYWTDREVEVDFNEEGAVFGSIYTTTTIIIPCLK